MKEAEDQIQHTVRTSPHQEHLASIADETLGFFQDTTQSAKSDLEVVRSHGGDVFASMNTLTALQATQNLSGISDERRRDLIHLCTEPAIARVVVLNEKDEPETFFITRVTPHHRASAGTAVASYRSPIGRLAALPVGAEVTLPTPRGARILEVIERAALRPSFAIEGWDSIDTKLEGTDYGPLTVRSLRTLLTSIALEDEADLLERMLSEDRTSNNVVDGIRRSVIVKMGLRDQPLLDQYQDEIFRLPLDSRLVLLGPPGSGKTTTLIKRLGLKLDTNFLGENERDLAESTAAGLERHSQSWLMFTPTELLKQYVKEAFARENIAAPDSRIQTWSDYRRELARNRFNILRTSTGSASYVLKENLTSLQPKTFEQQTEWFADFERWQEDFFWDELRTRAESLADNAVSPIKMIGKRLVDLMGGTRDEAAASPFVAIASMAKELQTLASDMKSDTDGKIRKSVSFELRRDPAFLDKLLAVLAGLADGGDESDESESEDEEETRQSRLGREAALDAYTKAVRAQARAELSGRSIGRQSRNAKIIEWLDGRLLPKDQLRGIGASLQLQTSIRRFINPARRYIDGLPLRYRRFRRERQTESKWYMADGFGPTDLAPLEIDLILLGMFRSARKLLRDRRILRDIDDGAYAGVKAVRDLFRTQILVDEATDFSPLQLACMAALADPVVKSFMACGDFNQRITEWGSRSVDDLKWVFPDIDVRSINITYRHSAQLNDLARRIVLISNPGATESELPPHVENEGMPAVLGISLPDTTAIVSWLSKRIVEIECFTGSLPTTAVLVNSEDDVQTIAKALDEALAEHNIRAIACPGGQAVGQDNDVRVFDVQHIKGLEFEAIFFLNIDRLSEEKPDLFDKYLYVGATRAATYLGITMAGSMLPLRLTSLRDCFKDNWAA